MNRETESFDTSDTPKCPDCGYIVFVGQQQDDGDWYCMECSTAWADGEVDND